MFIQWHLHRAYIHTFSPIAYALDLRRIGATFINGAPGLPSFHMMGVFLQVLLPLYGPITTAIFAPTVIKPEDVPPIGNPETVLECVRATKCQGLVVLPTFLHSWSQSPEAVDVLKTLMFVVSCCYLLHDSL